MLRSIQSHIWGLLAGFTSEEGTRLGVLIVVLLGLAWAIVLVPSLRPRFESSPADGVRNFERSMGVLANTRSDRQVPGRWVMVPKNAPAHRNNRRARVQERRRRAFVRLLFAAGATLVLGLIPGLRPLLIAHLVIDVVLVLTVVWLKMQADRERQRRRVVRALPRSEPVAAEPAEPSQDDAASSAAANHG